MSEIHIFYAQYCGPDPDTITDIHGAECTKLCTQCDLNSQGAGWFWQTGSPGGDPTGDPVGPFDSEQAAIDDVRAKHGPPPNLDPLTRLLSLRASFARSAQTVYDDWQPNSSGFDSRYGSGGICDEIAGAISEELEVVNCDQVVGGQPGDDHAYIIAVFRECQQAFAIDIPARFYETGGGFRWHKIPDVVFSEDYVCIDSIPYDDVADRARECDETPTLAD